MQVSDRVGLRKVFFDLDSSEWHGYATESVWAEPVAASRYRIRNTPFFAKGIGAEDVVFVQEKEGKLFFESVSITGGHSTYRIIIDKKVNDTQFSECWVPLQTLGCSYESAELGLQLLAVNVPPSANIYEVYALLERGEACGVWSFEEGHCGHMLAP